MRDWAERHRRPLGLGATAVCIVLAALWLVVVPSEADDADGLEAAILRYGHTLVWSLLGVTAFLVALGASRRAWNATATAAGVCYLVFVAAVVL